MAYRPYAISAAIDSYSTARVELHRGEARERERERERERGHHHQCNGIDLVGSYQAISFS